MAKKVEKEMPMTSAHGNKFFVIVFAASLMAATLLLGTLLSLKRAKIILYEKKYEATVSSIKERNVKEKMGLKTVESGQGE